MTYQALYAGLLLWGFMSYGKPATRHLLYFLVLIGLFIFVAFRYEVGCDWSGYYQNFLQQKFSTFEAAVESQNPAFWGALDIVHALGLEYPYINVICASLFFLGFHAFAVRQPDPLGFIILSFPILIINLPMSAIKQAAALGFICLAFNAMLDKRIVRFGVFILAASSFHATAIVFLFLAPFVNYKINGRTILIAVLLSIPGTYFMIADMLDIYTERYIDTGIDAAGGIFRVGLLVATGLPFVLFLRRPWQLRFPYDYKLALIGSFLMLALLPATFISSVAADRFGYYVIPLQLMILARLPYLIQIKQKHLVWASPYLIFGLAFLVWTRLSMHFSQCYVPYKSWLLTL